MHVQVSISEFNIYTFLRLLWRSLLDIFFSLISPFFWLKFTCMHRATRIGLVLPLNQDEFHHLWIYELAKWSWIHFFCIWWKIKNEETNPHTFWRFLYSTPGAPKKLGVWTCKSYSPLGPLACVKVVGSTIFTNVSLHQRKDWMSEF